MRLFDLQILKGDEMKRLSEQNRVRIKKILAPRGTIFDRKGRILGNTRPSFNLYIIPEDIKDFTETVDGIVNLLELDRDDIMERLKEARDFPSSFPVKILSDMSMDQVAKVEANKFYLPAISIQIEPKRNYPNGTMAAHVLGYVSEVSTDELKSPEFKKYAPGDPIGKFGLERMYEKDLRGVDGEKRVEVDASGREVRVLDIKEPDLGERHLSQHRHGCTGRARKGALRKKQRAQGGGRRRIGPPHGRGARPCKPPGLRSESAYLWLTGVLADHRPGRVSPAPKQGDPGTISAGVDLQAPHRAGGPGEGRHQRAHHLQLPGKLRLWRPRVQVLAEARATAPWPSTGPSSNPATSSSTTRA